MLNTIFSSIFTETTAAFTFGQFLACTAVSLILGLLIAAVYRYKSECTKSFAVTLVLMPVIVQMVIMLVNGNLGTGVAVAGAFSLVRFRSAPGSAKEISSIFLAMAVGLTTGMGFLGTAAAFAIIVEAVWFILVQTNFGEKKEKEKELRITIPESLDYTSVFDDIFARYLTRCELVQVKTTNMGSLFKLEYCIVFREEGEEKNMIDQLRCRNGNLEILCSRAQTGREEL